MPRAITGHRSDYHSGRSYKIRVIKMGHMITRTERHVKTKPITVEDFIRNEMSKNNQLQMVDKFDELVDHSTKLYKHKESNEHETNIIGIKK